MTLKSGKILLIALAILLAIIAISINLLAGEKVSTSPNSETIANGNGEMGIIILPPEGIEDKLKQEQTGEAG